MPSKSTPTLIEAMFISLNPCRALFSLKIFFLPLFVFVYSILGLLMFFDTHLMIVSSTGHISCWCFIWDSFVDNVSC